MFGRFLAIAMRLVTHVLIVRYLSKNDYGAFAYCLAIVAVGASLAIFGLNNTVARFAPIYEERGDDARLVGVLILVFGTVVSIGLAITVGFFLLQEMVATTLVGDPEIALLLGVFVFLIPLNALDHIFQAVLAIFADPRSIFLRRHIVAPALELGTVLLVMAGHGGVLSLAAGWVAAAVLGIALYTTLLWGVLRRQGLVERFRAVRPILPAREIFGFTLPLMSTDVVARLRGSVVVILIEAMRSTAEVAAFRAVLPLARQNQVVLQNFALLFTPAAARLYARYDGPGLNDLYWRTAMWITIVTFPIFLITFSLAGPATSLLLGNQYADSASITAILSVGFYISAVFGFNGLMLRVFGQVRYIVGIDIVTAAGGLVGIVILVGTFGAVGAAVGTTGMYLVQTALNHVALGARTPIRRVRPAYVRTYVMLICVVFGFLALEAIADLPLVATLALAVVIAATFLRANRNILDIGGTFPELLGIPVVGRWLRH